MLQVMATGHEPFRTPELEAWPGHTDRHKYKSGREQTLSMGAYGVHGTYEGHSLTKGTQPYEVHTA